MAGGASQGVPKSFLYERWWPRAWWAVIALTTLSISVGYVYYSIFSLFQGHDDEGFILISLKSFFQGKALYDQVYSSFQPAFYLLYWLLFQIWGAPLNHDNIRLVTLVLWLIGAGLNALITYRLTSSGVLSLLVWVVSVRCLEPLANEPGHPQAVAYVLVAGVAGLLTCANSIPWRILALTTGVLGGLVLLIKINVGVFLLLPLALLFALDKPGLWACWFRVGTVTAMAALPVVLWRAQLGAKDVPVGTLICLECLAAMLLIACLVSWRHRASPVAVAMLACVVALFGMNSVSVGALPVYSAGLLSLSICGAGMMVLAEAEQSRACDQRWLWASLGWVLTVTTVTLITLLRGTSYAGLAEGLFWWPLALSRSFLIRPRSNWLGAWLGVAGALGCYAYLRGRIQWRERAWFKTAIAGGQVALGLAVLAEFYLRVQGSSTLMPLHNDLPHFWMLPFAWLVAVPETGAEGTRVARLALLAITVMQPLLACPIAGSQLAPASLLIGVLGAVCLASGLRACIRWPVRWPGIARWRPVFAIAAATLLLVSFAQETLQLRQYYAARAPLGLPGAARIRLSPGEVQVYHELVDQLARPEVETFLTLPGMDSFYFWARKEPPNDLNVSAWIVLLDAPAQERIWRAAEAHPGLMVVRNRRLIRSWVRGRSVAQLPLVRHIEENFKTVATYGGYELMTRR